MRIRKRKLLILSIIIIAIAIYLNRSYALIYSYKEGPLPAKNEIQREYALSGKSQGKNIKYVALGDSLTYGDGANNYQETFAFILAQKLYQS